MMKKYITKQSNIKGAGKGLFTNAFFKKGEVIGLAHVNGQPTKEVGSNHNHNEKNPTANNIKNGNKRYLIASRNLKPGEEITTNYRLQPELEQPEDFEKKKDETMTPQKDGYRTYSPFKNLPYIDVESDTIDSDNIVYDLKLRANNGLTKFIKKNTGLHTLPGAKVIREIPVKRKGGALLTKKVTCKSCGWEWDAEDGGNDITTCHKCGGQGLVHAQDGGLHKFVGGGLQDFSPCQPNEYWDGEKCVKRKINYYNADEDLTKNAEYQDWLIRQALWEYSDLPYNKQNYLSGNIIKQTKNYNNQQPYDFQTQTSDFKKEYPETEDWPNDVNIGPYGSQAKFIESLTNDEVAKHSYHIIKDKNDMVNQDINKNIDSYKPFDKSNVFFNKYPPSSWSYRGILTGDPIREKFSGNWKGDDFVYKKPNTLPIEDNVDRAYLKKFYPKLTDEQINMMVKENQENPSYITNQKIKEQHIYIPGRVDGNDIGKGQAILKNEDGLTGYKADDINTYISQFNNYTPSWPEPKEQWLKKEEKIENLPILKPSLITTKCKTNEYWNEELQECVEIDMTQFEDAKEPVEEENEIENEEEGVTQGYGNGQLKSGKYRSIDWNGIQIPYKLPGWKFRRPQHWDRGLINTKLKGKQRYINLPKIKTRNKLTVSFKKQDGGNTDAMNGMMKARLAYANEFGNPAAERMINLPDNPYQFDNGDTGTHYMASMDNYAVPQIQDENGVLQLRDYGPESNEAIRFDSDEDANYFAENYKNVSPGFIEADLDEDEIEEYRRGGYIVEEIDTYQKGGSTKLKYKKPQGASVQPSIQKIIKNPSAALKWSKEQDAKDLIKKEKIEKQKALEKAKNALIYNEIKKLEDFETLEANELKKPEHLQFTPDIYFIDGSFSNPYNPDNNIPISDNTNIYRQPRTLDWRFNPKYQDNLGLFVAKSRFEDAKAKIRKEEDSKIKTGLVNHDGTVETVGQFNKRQNDWEHSSALNRLFTEAPSSNYNIKPKGGPIPGSDFITGFGAPKMFLQATKWVKPLWNTTKTAWKAPIPLGRTITNATAGTLTPRNLLFSYWAAESANNQLDSKSDVRKSQSNFINNPSWNTLGDAAFETGVNSFGFSGIGLGKQVIKPVYNASKNFINKKIINKTIPEWLKEELRFNKLPELNNSNATEVLDAFKKRIKTPEGQKRLKNLGITNTQILDDLKIVEDENTLGQYWMEKIGLNPNLPEFKNVTRHEIEHAVRDANINSRYDKLNAAIGNFKYLFNPKAKRAAIKAAEKQTTEIDDILSGLELKKTPEKVDWAQLNNDKGKKDPSKLFDYMSDNQRATNYFDSGSGGNEKSAFAAEVQQYMMTKGIIPSESYVTITPEMVKKVFIDAKFDKEAGGKYLRLFNIMKPSETNYKLISKALNKMLGVTPIIGLGAAATQYKQGGTTNDYIEAELTLKEIKDLIAQGYVIEELN